ncbi:MAG: ABC transporter permease subunit [Gammaproteobacteria bacterium]|nr:ABC transporter permease subunit [Gammaproteobacteria bacterium]
MDSTAGYNTAAVKARQKWRLIQDKIATSLVTVGGMSVIGAVLLIMFYLFYVVAPLFAPASMEEMGEYAVPGTEVGQTLHLSIEEKLAMGTRITDQGQLIYFNAKTGELAQQTAVDGGVPTAWFPVSEYTNTHAFGFDNGNAQIVTLGYKTSYIDGVRQLAPRLEYPLGEDPLEIDEDGGAITSLAVAIEEEEATLVGVVDGDIAIAYYTLEESFLSDGLEAELDSIERFTPDISPDYVLLDPLGEWLYIGSKEGQVEAYRVYGAEAQLNQLTSVTTDGAALTDLRFLRGGISLLAATTNGEIHQFFPVRDSQNKYKLELVRSFETDHGNAIKALATEHRRKGFATIDNSGALGVFYTTSKRTLMQEKLAEGLVEFNVSPRSDAVIAETNDGQLKVIHLDNEHPEISLSSLWGKVWYESYPEPAHIWQSSAADDDFEPKYSLTPLAFGTLKAAFYAMLLALPLAVAGAVYTAYFMAPSMRKVVKPVIEIMEALPTVILGFLAGLWLAPLMEDQLLAAFLVVPMVLVAILVFGFVWERSPEKIRLAIPEGWQPGLLIPVIIIAAAVAFALDNPIENAFFDGNTAQWLTNVAGIDYDQRNALVVGFAMGFAVIPTIFSITEDAVFGVPKHLSNGSLALGATPWQTLVRVVLPTASPGMFSAVMIGLGRAVGETMIVLMATGNTPVMDFNIFEGMRTLSANIAVEMPESEVGSSHYRILFLAGLVLFIFTFMFNTIAELVRQRLRAKYSQL